MKARYTGEMGVDEEREKQQDSDKEFRNEKGRTAGNRYGRERDHPVTK